MITTNVITSLFQHIKGYLTTFPINTNIIYHPQLDFSDIGIQYTVTDENYNKTEGENKKWIQIIWRRGKISKSSISGRPRFNTLEKETYKKYKVKQVETNLDISFFCSDITLAENLEEELILNFPEDLYFDYEIPNISGTFKALAVLNFDNNFEKLEKTTFGAITNITISSTLTYFIVGKPAIASVIEKIDIKYFNENVKPPSLIEEEKIN